MRSLFWVMVWGAVVLGSAAPAWAEAAWPDLSVATEGARPAKADAALLIGVEDYAFVPDVPGALQNVNDWYAFMTRGRGVPLAQVTLLRNQEATRERILKEAARVAGEVGEGGTLWVVFVGHGAPAADGRDGVLVGVDAQQSADGLYARSVSHGELLTAMKPAGERARVLLLDACFSGLTGSGAPIAPGLQPLVPVKAAPQGDTLTLTAARSDQFAGPLPGTQRPAFSYLMLGALRGWADANGDGQVSAAEAVAYTEDALRVTVRGRSQNPEMIGADRVLHASAREAGPDLGAIVLGKPAGGGGGGAAGGGRGESGEGQVRRDDGGVGGGGASGGGASAAVAAGDAMTLRQSVNLGASNTGALYYQVRGEKLAVTVGVGGWFVNATEDDDDLAGFDAKFGPLLSLGLRRYFTSGKIAFFMGSDAGVFLTTGEECVELTTDSDGNRECTASNEFRPWSLSAYLGGRWAIAQDYNLTARVGGGLIFPGFDFDVTLSPDFELSFGYNF